jgi:hypothetical protein
MEFFLPHLALAFAIGWRVAYCVIAGLFLAEAWKALRCGEPCRMKWAKAVAYCLIVAKALTA